jgi:hypothetical protein
VSLLESRHQAYLKGVHEDGAMARFEQVDLRRFRAMPQS